MNIDLFGGSEVQWWWYAVLGTAVFFLVLSAWACFKHYGVRHHVRDTRSYSWLTHEFRRRLRHGMRACSARLPKTCRFPGKRRNLGTRRKAENY